MIDYRFVRRRKIELRSGLNIYHSKAVSGYSIKEINYNIITNIVVNDVDNVFMIDEFKID